MLRFNKTDFVMFIKTEYASNCMHFDISVTQDMLSFLVHLYISQGFL